MFRLRPTERRQLSLFDCLLWVLVTAIVAGALSAVTDGVGWLPDDAFLRALLFFACILLVRYAVYRLLYHDGNIRIKRR